MISLFCPFFQGFVEGFAKGLLVLSRCFFCICLSFIIIIIIVCLFGFVCLSCRGGGDTVVPSSEVSSSSHKLLSSFRGSSFLFFIIIILFRCVGFSLASSSSWRQRVAVFSIIIIIGAALLTFPFLIIRIFIFAGLIRGRAIAVFLYSL